MQIIKPIVHETVWGGEKLTPVSGSDCKKIGHLYSCIDTKKMCSEISWVPMLAKPFMIGSLTIVISMVGRSMKNCLF